MRHAKSDWDADYDMDHDRPLNDRGMGAARLIGTVLSRRGLIPALIVTSTAVRARTTAELANEAGRWGTPIELEPSFYGGAPLDVIDRVSRSPEVSPVMVVGHQPSWGSLVTSLTGERVDMKTATVAVVQFDGPWRDVAPGRGRLIDLLQPRELEGGAGPVNISP